MPNNKYMLNADNPSANNPATDVVGKEPVPEVQQKIPESSPKPMDQEFLYMFQQAKEEAKFELKKEISDSLNAKAMELQEVDPTTSACLRASAIAVASALSSVVAIGENQEFNASAQKSSMGGPSQQSMMQGQSQKMAMDLNDYVYHTVVDYLTKAKYFELNKEASEDFIVEDLNEVVQQIKKGMDIYSDEHSLDFTDNNTWELLEDLINDRTLFQLGSE